MAFLRQNLGKNIKIFSWPKANFGIILHIFPTNKCMGAYWRGSIYYNKYGNCVFLISASKNQTVYFRDLVYYLFRSIQNFFFFFYEDTEVGFYFGIFDIYFGIGDICPKLFWYI